LKKLNKKTKILYPLILFLTFFFGVTTITQAQIWKKTSDPLRMTYHVSSNTKEAKDITDKEATLQGEMSITIMNYPQGCSGPTGNIPGTDIPCNNGISVMYPFTGYFRYTKKGDTPPPIYCNDIFGTGMQSTPDKKIAVDQTPGYKYFSQRVVDLEPDTDYYYCAIVSNQDGVFYAGEQTVKSFKTLPCQDCDKTTITTKEARSFSESAILKGNFSSTKPTKTYFEYREYKDLKEKINNLFFPENPATPEEILPAWKRVGEKDHSMPSSNYVKETRHIHGNINFTLSNIKPSTRYEYRAVAESELGVFWGEIKQFTTKDSVAVRQPCEVTGTCPIDYEYCDLYPDDPICTGVTTPYPDLTAGAIKPTSSLIDQLTTFMVSISNLGDVDTSETLNWIIHNFEINTGENNETNEIIYVNGPGIKAKEKNEIQTKYSFSSAGIKQIRACASAVEGQDLNLNNNCGPWTKILITCPAPQYYSPEEGICKNPISCDPDTEIYDWITKSCILKTICEEGETYVPWTNECLVEIDCSLEENEDHWLCKPGPGWDWTGGGDGGGWGWTGGGDGGGWSWIGDGDGGGWVWNDDGGNGGSSWTSGGGAGGTWTGGGWTGGTWTGGGWIGNSWFGGVWNGSQLGGGTWIGGVWQNGNWSGGGWASQIGPVGLGGGSGGGDGTPGSLSLGQTATPPWDAIVRYHEGVEHVFARQIINNTALQQKYGYQPGTNLEFFAWEVADLLARIFGYIDEDGREIRVSYPDIAAYELRLTGNQLIIYEYYDYKIVGIQNMTDIFKTKAGYEYYFKK